MSTGAWIDILAAEDEPPSFSAESVAGVSIELPLCLTRFTRCDFIAHSEANRHRAIFLQTLRPLERAPRNPPDTHEAPPGPPGTFGRK